MKEKKKLNEQQMNAILYSMIVGVVGVTAMFCYISGYKFGYHIGVDQLSNALFDYLNTAENLKPDDIASILFDYETIFNPKVLKK